jgi:glycosyltransferase involved in cell wall biosynthesis
MGEMLSTLSDAALQGLDDGADYGRPGLAADCWLLERSGLLDAAAYREAAGLPVSVSAAEHYLCQGWRLGLEPNPRFDGNLLYPYYRSIGLEGPPALSHLRLRAAGGATCATFRQAMEEAASISGSGLFDAAGYAARVGNIDHLDPTLHYVIVGERLGFAPSEDFDPDFYGELNPEVSAAGMNLLAHYIAFGKSEGRRAASLAAKLTYDTTRIDPQRETVLQILHQATRTGAPVLAYNVGKRLRERYNVVTLLLDGGELTQDFAAISNAVVGPIARSDWYQPEIDRLIGRVLARYQVAYVVANTIDSRVTFEPLARHCVPVVALIHEFSNYVRPAGEMGRALEWPTQTVFSANVVAASARAEYPALDKRSVHIIPQGPSELPPRPGPARTGNAPALREAVRPPGMEDAFVVLGCGTVTNRKGVDLFLACADAVAALAPRRPVRFVWIGRGTDTDMDRRYGAELAEQRARMAAPQTVTMLDEVPDLEPAYASADLFFLSSRLDPLPNVCIDSALRGIPIVCFEGVSGFADLLSENDTTSACVIPELDVGAAAQAIARLAGDRDACSGIAQATRAMAQTRFDMDAYVRNIDGLGRSSMAIMQQRKADLETIEADPTFDVALFQGYDLPLKDRREAIARYLARSAAMGSNRQPTRNFYYRRPTPGFHPQIYAHECGDQFDPAVVNPLAHFLRAGKPRGPWRHEVIVPAPWQQAAPVAAGQRIALHGHFFYPELAADCLQRLAANTSPCDLLLSTDDERKAEVLRATTQGYGGEVVIRVVPNRGRDIGAFLTAFAGDIVGRYDIVGHIHGKRTRHEAAFLGETWREFLWQHLIGDLHPMLDIVMDRFAEDRGLGMVFAGEPHLSDWDGNLDIAKVLARRVGLAEALPPYFDFPVGTMFWARTQALRPMFDLALGWEDYPEEPLPIDGTILHALERLLPFVARHAGYRYATTHVPGVTW